ncbi:MAG: hypothetical protein GX247_01335 [Mollicutes bacterium]|nr:hypothetical protein [Mollicutes bacterium]
MILRKPYAFFIKHFKLFHIILTILITYLIYRTGLLLSFFNEYIATSQSVINQDLTGKLFNTYMFISPFLIILGSIVILSVMILKKKPILFYIVLIIIYILMIVLYNYIYSVLGAMETNLLDIRQVRLARDILTIGSVAQAFSVVITFVRATGFDIRKFNFGQDLAQLDIKEEDREEFEFEVSLDTDKLRRKLRRNFRYLKYTYIENKFLINIGILLFLSTICFIIYLNLTVYNKVFNEMEAFLTTDFSVRINKSFLTTKDYKGNDIVNDNETLVVLEVAVRNNFSKAQKLDIAKTQLVINNQAFYHVYSYRDRLFDLGKVYEDQLLPNQFTKWLLVYKVPKFLISNNMYFKYVDKVNVVSRKLNPKTISVRLNPKNLDVVSKTKEFQLGETMVLNDSILGNVEFKIDKYEINDEYRLTYNFCVTKDECYPSYEYVKPNITNRYDMALMYLNGKMKWDEEIAVNPITNIYSFINNFGELVYEIDDKTKVQKVGFKQINPVKVKVKDDYYIEVLDEVKKANKIALVFNLRNIQYKYVLKV